MRRYNVYMKENVFEPHELHSTTTTSILEILVY